MAKRLFTISMLVFAAMVIVILTVSFAYAAPTTGTISYTVTEKVNMTADSTGELTVDPIVIENTGELDILVGSVQIAGLNGWTLIPDTTDFAKLPADSKQFSLVADGSHDMISAYMVDETLKPGHTYITMLTGKTGIVTTAVADEKAADFIITVSIQEPECEDFVVTESNRYMIGYTDETTELVIPETFQGSDGIWYRVIGIDNNAFNGCENIKTIVIPDSVTSIGNFAFKSAQIMQVEIPDSVTTMGQGVFNGCNQLNDVIIGSGLTSISPGTFSNCISLKKIQIPDNITKIGNGAFTATGLEYVDIPDSVITIDRFAFYTCTSLKKISIGGGVESIGSDAFHVRQETDTIVITENDVAKNYDWVGDKRNVTLYSNAEDLYTEMLSGRDFNDFMSINGWSL